VRAAQPVPDRYRTYRRRMTLTTKHIFSLVAGIAVIIGWNYFLIQRDAKMFGTNRAQTCRQLETWHPDCK